jgi:[methyl-Co(III) methanol-specific corrinoid protein]:coenzyme M methyltransferase
MPLASEGSSRDRFLAALRRERVRPIPVGAVTQSASRAQMDALGIHWPAAHFDAGLMAGLADGARTILGFDMVRVPFDQTIEAELLGAQVNHGDATGNCSVVETDLRSVFGQAGGLSPRGRATTVIDAISLLRDCATGAAVIGGIVGPFTLVCQLAGVSRVLMDAVRQPDGVRPWLDFAVATGSQYARLQVEAGADAICIEDMSASLDLASPRIYQNLILPAQQKLIAAIGAPVILHICGSNTKILELLTETGAAALSLEDRTDLARAAALDRCAIIGGVPPVEVLLHGAPEDVARASAASLSAGVHVLAPGCGIPPETPTDNLLEMVRVAHEWQA